MPSTAVITVFTIRSDNYERLQTAAELEGVHQEMARPHAAGLSLSPVSRAEGVHVRNLAPACGVRVGVRGICDQSIAA